MYNIENKYETNKKKKKEKKKKYLSSFLNDIVKIAVKLK